MIKATKAYCYEEVRNYEKFYSSKALLKMAGGGCIPHIPPPGSAPACAKTVAVCALPVYCKFYNNVMFKLGAFKKSHGAMPPAGPVVVVDYRTWVGKLFHMAGRCKSENFSRTGHKNEHKYSAIKLYFSSYYNNDSMRTMSLFCSN